MTYFHMGIHTIIGAESFHGPVRDGKGWFQLAMAAKHNWSLRRDLHHAVAKTEEVRVYLYRGKAA